MFETLLGSAVRDAVPFHEAAKASTVLVEHIPQSFPIRSRPMTTVDRIVATRLGKGVPDLLKLDVQGYELEVLRGAEGSLSRVQAVLAEINLIDIHVGVPLLAEVVSWLAERDWVAYDVCALTWRPLDAALWQVDMVRASDEPASRQQALGVSSWTSP